MVKLSRQRSLIRSSLFASFLCAISTFSSKANDGTAELATGGLVFVKNNDVAMLSEDLFISTEQIRVSYRFLNKSNKDIIAYVAFPLPDLKMDPVDDVTEIPTDDSINFVGFSTTVDGCQRAAESPHFGACNFPHLAGWRSAVFLISASVFRRSTTTLDRGGRG